MSIAQKKINFDFRVKNDHTTEKYGFDDPVKYFLNNTIGEIFEDCLHFFERFKFQWEFEVKFVPGENAKGKSFP